MKLEYLIDKTRQYLYPPLSQGAQLKMMQRIAASNGCSDYGGNQDNTSDKDTLATLLDQKRESYQPYLKSVFQYTAMAIGALAFTADFYNAFVSTHPLTGAQYAPLHNALILAKAATEIKVVYDYVRATKDWSGVLYWFAHKPVELAIPLLGPLAGLRLTQRMATRGMMKEINAELR